MVGYKKESYKSGALKLMIAAFVVRILGFANRIYMSNILGAEGMGLFQLASPVYSLIILTLTSGVSISVSGLTAKEKANGNQANALRIVKIAFAVLLISGTVCATFLAYFADSISVTLLKDERVYYSLIMLAPCIPIVASASAIKGYFYGSSNVTPTAFSQITEQIVRIGVIFFVANKIANTNLAYACAIATTSAAFGEMANLAVVGIAFLRENSNQKASISRREAASSILKLSMPISVNRLIISLMGMLETVLLPIRFASNGRSYTQGIEILGRISGMAMPLVAFPTLITSSVATTLVPAISEAISTKNYKLANHRISNCLTMGFLLGFIFFSIYNVLGVQAGNILYPGNEVGIILKELSYCCIFMYVEQIMSGILNGLGKQGISLATSAAGYIAIILSIWYGVPEFGMEAYIWGNFIGMAVTVLLNLIVISTTTGLALELRNWMVKPLALSILVIIAGKITDYIYIENSILRFILSGIYVSLTVLVLLATMFKNLKWGELLWKKIQTKKQLR